MTIRVLLVEDHKILREGTRELLEQTNDLAVVAESATGEEAITLCRQLQPDVVVMDVRMPGMSGDDAARQLRAQGFTAPIIALTGNADPVERAVSLQAGFSDYLVKPVSRQGLYEALQAAGL